VLYAAPTASTKTRHILFRYAETDASQSAAAGRRGDNLSQPGVLVGWLSEPGSSAAMF